MLQRALSPVQKRKATVLGALAQWQYRAKRKRAAPLTHESVAVDRIQEPEPRANQAKQHARQGAAGSHAVKYKHTQRDKNSGVDNRGRQG